MSELGNDDAFCWAIASLFAWLVPRISMLIGEYHRAIRKTPFWTSAEAQASGRSEIRKTIHFSNLLGVAIIAGTATAVALTTKNLEPNMVLIINGLSRLVGATFIFLMSWSFPEWLEVYNVRARKDVLPMTRSLRALRFNIMWGILGQYSCVYFFLMPFYCGANAAMIPISAIVGILVGIIVDVCVYWGHQHIGTRKNWFILFGMVFIAVIGSGVLFASGVLYINDVWGNHYHSRALNEVSIGSCFAWIVAALLFHFLAWRFTKNENKKTSSLSASDKAKSFKYQSTAGKVILEKGRKITGSERITPQDKPFADDRPQDENGRGRQVHGVVLQDQDDGDDYDPWSGDPSFVSLCKSKCWCSGGCCAGKETCSAKTFTCAKWTVWWILAAFSLYFVIVNAGATYQQDVVRARLPSVREVLYHDMNDIEVCAYDGDGTTGSLNENSNITTFPSKEAANEAGFLVLHCGACAACSTWPNIKYEYTTRTFLADASGACGRMSLLGGPDAVLKCLMSEPINWDHDCGKCWQVDIDCAKGYCVFIFLQSTMINTMTTYDVGPDDITSATCEEANCEAFPYPENFVECSGATRRRMNVPSSIERPKSEQCKNVDVDWATLFPEDTNSESEQKGGELLSWS